MKDLDKFRPERPRDPLKKTANNNWAHVVCAVWTPEIKFSDPNSLKVIEGIGTIPQARWIQECKICKLGSGTNGACVQCANTNCHTSGTFCSFPMALGVVLTSLRSAYLVCKPSGLEAGF